MSVVVRDRELERFGESDVRGEQGVDAVLAEGSDTHLELHASGADDIRAECLHPGQPTGQQRSAQPVATLAEVDAEERELAQVLEELQSVQKALQPASEEPATVKS